MKAAKRQERPPMQVGIYVSARAADPVGRALERFTKAEERGFRTAWTGQTFDHEALTLLALAGRETERIELGSWVVPVYGRHPLVMAQQALTAQSASGGRLLLGIGAGHTAVVEKRLGLDHSGPLVTMREYLEVLQKLLRGEAVEHEGEVFRVRARVGTLGTEPPALFLAALGPGMLGLAGARADGVAIWLGGPRYLEDFAIPRIQDAAWQATRLLPPRIACGLPVAVCSDREAGRRSAEAFLAPSAKLPAYRRVLELDGARSPADVAILGDEDAVSRRLDALAKLGVTDFNAVLFPVEGDADCMARTTAFLAERARAPEPRRSGA